jgi:hypothetical protein
VKSGCQKTPSRSTIKRLVNKFEATGNMINNKNCAAGRMKLVRTSENIHCAQQALMQSPKESVKYLARQLNSAASSTHKIIQDNVKAFMYRIQM